MMKLLRIDSTGNLIVGTIAILICGIIILSIFVVTGISLMEKNSIDSISNDNFKYIMEDYNKNIEKYFHESIEEVTEKVNVIILSAHSKETVWYQIEMLTVVKRFVQKPLTRRKLKSILQDYYY